MFENVKKVCDFFLDMGIPGFDIIVYKDGKCILRHTGGYADPEKKIPVSGKEKYHIYSCSKLLTCTAALQLWEKGLFRLEDKLSDYIPAFRDMMVQTESGLRKAEKPILIENLFSMTSGMTYALRTPELLRYYEACNYTCPTVEMVEQLAKTPLAFEPGEGWLYSLSHDVLAALVEILSGEKFEIYVKKNILDPLGMNNTDFLHPMEDWDGFARQFCYDSQQELYAASWENPYRPGREYASGGAGCVSTVEDFIQFLEALRIGDVVLKKETIAMMAKNRVAPELRKMCPQGYGLGVRPMDTDENRREFGWGGAAGAFASVDLANNMTIFYAQHVRSSPTQLYRIYLYHALKADLLGTEFRMPEYKLPADPKITY